MRKPSLRRTFVVLALVAAALALTARWEAASAAIRQIPLSVVAGSLALSVIHVCMTMLSWRALLCDLGRPVSLRPAASLFFVSQLAKYLPGGVWNVVAAAEMGSDLDVPRRRSVSVMVIWWLVNVVTALTIALAAFPLAPRGVVSDYSWVALAIPLMVLVLTPPVINRLLDAVLRRVQRPPLERPVSGSGIAKSASWSVCAWLAAGTQVWLIATSTGLQGTVPTFVLAVGGFALAWAIGFIVVFAPAGVGVREAVLAAVLAEHLDVAAAVVTVLVSRVAITLADILLGVGALALRRRTPASIDRRRVKRSRQTPSSS